MPVVTNMGGGSVRGYGRRVKHAPRGAGFRSTSRTAQFVADYRFFSNPETRNGNSVDNPYEGYHGVVSNVSSYTVTFRSPYTGFLGAVVIGGGGSGAVSETGSNQDSGGGGGGGALAYVNGHSITENDYITVVVGRGGYIPSDDYGVDGSYLNNGAGGSSDVFVHSSSTPSFSAADCIISAGGGFKGKYTSFPSGSGGYPSTMSSNIRVTGDYNAGYTGTNTVFGDGGGRGGNGGNNSAGNAGGGGGGAGGYGGSGGTGGRYSSGDIGGSSGSGGGGSGARSSNNINAVVDWGGGGTGFMGAGANGSATASNAYASSQGSGQGNYGSPSSTETIYQFAHSTAGDVTRWNNQLRYYGVYGAGGTGAEDDSYYRGAPGMPGVVRLLFAVGYSSTPFDWTNQSTVGDGDRVVIYEE